MVRMGDCMHLKLYACNHLEYSVQARPQQLEHQAGQCKQDGPPECIQHSNLHTTRYLELITISSRLPSTITATFWSLKLKHSCKPQGPLGLGLPHSTGNPWIHPTTVESKFAVSRTYQQ